MEGDSQLFWDSLKERISGLPEEIASAFFPEGTDVSSLLGPDANIFKALGVGLTGKFA